MYPVATALIVFTMKVMTLVGVMRIIVSGFLHIINLSVTINLIETLLRGGVTIFTELFLRVRFPYI
jgi:hypothetical protein